MSMKVNSAEPDMPTQGLGASQSKPVRHVQLENLEFVVPENLLKMISLIDRGTGMTFSFPGKSDPKLSGLKVDKDISGNVQFSIVSGVFQSIERGLRCVIRDITHVPAVDENIATAVTNDQTDLFVEDFDHATVDQDYSRSSGLVENVEKPVGVDLESSKSDRKYTCSPRKKGTEITELPSGDEGLIRILENKCDVDEISGDTLSVSQSGRVSSGSAALFGGGDSVQNYDPCQVLSEDIYTVPGRKRFSPRLSAVCAKASKKLTHGKKRTGRTTNNENSDRALKYKQEKLDLKGKFISCGESIKESEYHETEAKTKVYDIKSETRKPRQRKVQANSLHCRFCQHCAKTCDDLIDHLNHHHEDQSGKEAYIEEFTKVNQVVCVICKENMMRDMLKNHTNTVHKSTEGRKADLTCRDCNKNYRSLLHLKAHITRAHPKFRFLCHLCPATFKTKVYLQEHVDICHEKKLAYMCSVCGEKFLARSVWVRHKRKHENKTYCCPHCSREFFERGNMVRHVNTMHGSGSRRKEICEHCHKVFSSATNLTQHVRSIHFGEFSFECEICGKGFRRKKALADHVEFHHKLSNNHKFSCSKMPNKEKTQKFSCNPGRSELTKESNEEAKKNMTDWLSIPDPDPDLKSTLKIEKLDSENYVSSASIPDNIESMYILITQEVPQADVSQSVENENIVQHAGNNTGQPIKFKIGGTNLVSPENAEVLQPLVDRSISDLQLQQIVDLAAQLEASGSQNVVMEIDG